MEWPQRVSNWASAKLAEVAHSAARKFEFAGCGKVLKKSDLPHPPRPEPTPRLRVLRVMRSIRFLILHPVRGRDACTIEFSLLQFSTVIFRTQGGGFYAP